MAQKLALLHNGTRKTVSVGPRMIVQDLIGSVAALYGIDTTASAVSLQHRHVLLNPAEIVCHISIPNNATIDVIVTSRKSAVGGVTKLTLVGRDKSTWTSSFPSHSSLQDVISAALSATNTDGTAVFSAADVPVGVIYMRRPCTGEALTAKLSDLGLAGQAAKLQLIFGDNAPPVSDQDIASTVAVLPSQVAIADACGVADLGRPDMQGDISGPPAGSVAAPPLSAVHVDLDVAPIAPSIPASYDTTPAVVSHNCDDAINHILTNNFDVASQPAILLFLKYIDNILKNPTDIKYHRIPTSNKVYVEKLGRLRGTDELLSAAGFFKKAEDATVWLARVECDISHWKVVRKSIIMAAETLSISSDLYSTSPPAPNIFSAVPAPVEFDPFRAMVTKTFSTDGANTKILSTDNKGIYMTETDKKLAGIERRRVELEGRPEDVERLTQVLK